MNEQAASPDLLLLEGMVYGQGRTRHHVLVVHIGRDADDAPGRRADVDELHHRISPHDVAVDRILIRKHPLRQALAHDDDRLATSAVGIVEVASGNHRDAERRKESGRDCPQLRARIFFARRAHVAVRRKLEARTKAAGVAPGNDDAKGDAIHAGQLRNAPHGFFVKSRDLIGRPSVRNRRYVYREYVPGVEAGLRGLQREQCLKQHAGAGQQHEGRGDLCHGEDA